MQQGWFKMYWNFLDELTPESALLYAYLLEIEPIMKNRDGEFFRLSNSFIQERFLTWSDYVIKAKLDELIEKGYIEVTQKFAVEHTRGCRTRWIKLKHNPEDNTKDKTNNNPEKLGIKETKETEETKDNIYTSEVTEIVNYLNQKANTKYRINSDKTKKAIVARLNEKYTVDDFKHVIDVKCAEWLGNPEFEKYLRPETLFGNKFENYLQQKITTKVTQPSKPQVFIKQFNPADLSDKIY